MIHQDNKNLKSLMFELGEEREDRARSNECIILFSVLCNPSTQGTLLPAAEALSRCWTVCLGLHQDGGSRGELGMEQSRCAFLQTWLLGGQN